MKININDLKIEIKNIDDITPYENNVKLHPQEHVDQIIASIEKYGFNDPIAVDQDSVVIEGHGRLMALEQLGIKEVPVIILKHLTEDEKKEYILAHNKLNMNTGFDPKLLKIELESINIENLGTIGFSDKEIKKFYNKGKKDTGTGEVQFTEELLEKHNYVVLYFDNGVDWLNLMTRCGSLIVTKKDSSSKEGYEKKGVGRVVDGVKFLELVGGDND